MLILGKSPHILGKTIYLHQSNASYVPVLCCIHWFDKQTSSHITIMSCLKNILRISLSNLLFQCCQLIYQNVLIYVEVYKYIMCMSGPCQCSDKTDVFTSIHLSFNIFLTNPTFRKVVKISSKMRYFHNNVISIIKHEQSYTPRLSNIK